MDRPTNNEIATVLHHIIYPACKSYLNLYPFPQTLKDKIFTKILMADTFPYGWGAIIEQIGEIAFTEAAEFKATLKRLSS